MLPSWARTTWRLGKWRSLERRRRRRLAGEVFKIEKKKGDGEGEGEVEEDKVSR